MLHLQLHSHSCASSGNAPDLRGSMRQHSFCWAYQVRSYVSRPTVQLLLNGLVQLLQPTNHCGWVGRLFLWRLARLQDADATSHLLPLGTACSSCSTGSSLDTCWAAAAQEQLSHPPPSQDAKQAPMLLLHHHASAAALADWPVHDSTTMLRSITFTTSPGPYCTSCSNPHSRLQAPASCFTEQRSSQLTWCLVSPFSRAMCLTTH